MESVVIGLIVLLGIAGLSLFWHIVDAPKETGCTGQCAPSRNWVVTERKQEQTQEAAQAGEPEGVWSRRGKAFMSKPEAERREIIARAQREARIELQIARTVEQATEKAKEQARTDFYGWPK